MKKSSNGVIMVVVVLVIAISAVGTIYFMKSSNQQIGVSSYPPNILDEQVEANIIQKTDIYVDLQEQKPVIKELTEDVGKEILGKQAEDYLKYFDMEKVSATILVKENSVLIIPAPDFVDNQEFYYDENGNIVLYRTVSVTVGGQNSYYFDNGKLLYTIVEYGEENAQVQLEEAKDIKERAIKIYDEYIKIQNIQVE